MSLCHHRFSDGDCFLALSQHFLRQNYVSKLRSFERAHDFYSIDFMLSSPNPICAIILPDQNIHRSDPAGFAVRKMPTAVLVGFMRHLCLAGMVLFTSVRLETGAWRAESPK